MVAQGGFNRTAILVHALAIAAGLLAGWFVMDRITPDLPTEDPGVESSSAPRSVAGNDPDSLFLPNNFSDGLAQFSDQLAAGQSVTTLHLTPGSISAETTDGDAGFDPADVPSSAPASIAHALHRTREEVGLADIGSMDLIATRTGPTWYVKLDLARSDAGPPFAYTAPLSGANVTPANGPPSI